MIPVDLIDPHPHNPRRDLGEVCPGVRRVAGLATRREVRLVILDPIRAAVQHLYDTTPPPVTVYGVRFADGDIEWCADRDDAIDVMADEPGAHLVTVTGHVRTA